MVNERPSTLPNDKKGTADRTWDKNGCCFLSVSLATFCVCNTGLKNAHMLYKADRCTARQKIVSQIVLVGVCFLFPPSGSWSLDAGCQVRGKGLHPLRHLISTPPPPSPCLLFLSCFFSTALKNKWIVWYISSCAKFSCGTLPTVCCTMYGFNFLAFLGKCSFY